jgi:hypothetical protein
VDFEHGRVSDKEEARARALTETGRGGGIADRMKEEGEDEIKSAVIIMGLGERKEDLKTPSRSQDRQS